MLSKRQAKWFFLGGTILFSLIFLAMSIHSLSVGIPEHMNEAQMNEQVRHGKFLWEEKNCMGCHTIMGEGAYYAPELTKVYSRRGAGYIQAVLSSPNGWSRGGKRMVAYDFTPEEREALIAFFEWMDKADLNGFPAKPSPALRNGTAN